MYGKVFDSMFDGTLASRGPWQALVTFQQMIVLANQDGIVDMTADAISRRTSIPLDIIELGISELMKPDLKSRTPDEDGRRIVLVDDHRDWGWQIVNHAKYQAMRNAAERREYLRIAQAERRARLKAEREQLSTPVNNVNAMSAKVNTSTPTDTNSDSNAIKKRTARATRLPEDFSPDVEFAKKHGIQDVVREIEQFRDWWKAAPGSKGTKLDWPATWRTWCRNAKKTAPKPSAWDGAK
jgi:hypothetical protein